LRIALVGLPCDKGAPHFGADAKTPSIYSNIRLDYV
jgi:hypothetical protein